MKIQVHLERLVLEGLELPHRQRPLFQAAVEAELARLLLDGGLPPDLLSGVGAEALSAGEIRLRPEAGPQAFGSQVARAVYGSLVSGTVQGDNSR